MSKTVYKLNGKTVTRDEFLENKKGFGGGTPMTSIPGNWPMKSDALGCHPSQVKDLTKWYKDRGVDVSFDSECRMDIKSRGHRNDVLRVSQMRDNNAGYGDYAGKT